MSTQDAELTIYKNDLLNIINNIFPDTKERNTFLSRYSEILLSEEEKKTRLEIWFGDGCNDKSTLCQIFTVLFDLANISSKAVSGNELPEKTVYICEDADFNFENLEEVIHNSSKFENKTIIAPLNHISKDHDLDQEFIYITRFTSRFSLQPENDELLSDREILTRIRMDKDKYKAALIDILKMDYIGKRGQIVGYDDNEEAYLFKIDGEDIIIHVYINDREGVILDHTENGYFVKLDCGVIIEVAHDQVSHV